MEDATSYEYQESIECYECGINCDLVVIIINYKKEKTILCRDCLKKLDEIIETNLEE